MVPCDANATDASTQIDVFTLARNKGAKAAVSIGFLTRVKNSCPMHASYSILRTLWAVLSTPSILILTLPVMRWTYS